MPVAAVGRRGLATLAIEPHAQRLGGLAVHGDVTHVEPELIEGVGRVAEGAPRARGGDGEQAHVVDADA
eukprot:285856-Pyramimonas_sp.AAC.1